MYIIRGVGRQEALCNVEVVEICLSVLCAQCRISKQIVEFYMDVEFYMFDKLGHNAPIFAVHLFVQLRSDVFMASHLSETGKEKENHGKFLPFSFLCSVLLTWK